MSQKLGLLFYKIKKYVYYYLKCILYDKLFKPRQSFWITLCYWRTRFIQCQSSGLQKPGLRLRIYLRIKNLFFFFSNFQIASGARLSFYSIGDMYKFFLGIKWPKRETDHPYPPSANGAIQGEAPPSELQVFSSDKKILRKIKLSTWIKVIVKRYVHRLKEYELNHFKIKVLATNSKRYEEERSERAVLYSDVPRWRQRK